MDEAKKRSNEISIDNWFTVCDAEENVQVIFPTENFAHWYLEKCGWTGWKIRQVIKNAEGLFFLEEQRDAADNDKEHPDA